MIRLEKVSKSFGSKEVLKDITFNIKKGEILGLVGKNGAGKTTLISILAGLIDASSGEIYYQGSLIRDKNIKVGYLPDVPSFYDYLTVREYIDFLSQSQLSSDEIEQIIKVVGLQSNDKIKGLSRGMRQRLGMAAVLVNDPEIILLDEPSSALDPEGRAELSNLLCSLKKDGKTILLSTHILTDMEKICDTVVFLKEGCVSKIVDVNDSNEQYEIKLTFKNPLEQVEELAGVTVVSETEIIISSTAEDIETQLIILIYLYDIKNPIIKIETKQISLDAIFNEVCL